MRDELLALGELKPLEELTGVPDREARDRRDGLPVQQDREAFGLQPVALADWAQRQGAVILFLVFVIFAEHGAALRRLVAQTVADGASPVRAVEREEAGGGRPGGGTPAGAGPTFRRGSGFFPPPPAHPPN